MSETRGVTVAPGARLEVEGARFHGAQRVGIESEKAALRVRDVVFEGPVTAIKALHGELSARRVRISGGRGPGISLVGGTADLREVAVHGHEYGLLANRSALSVTDFVSVRPERTALGLVETNGTLEGVISLDSGSYGGVQLINSELTLRRFVVARAREAGVGITGGKVRVEDGVVIGVADASGSQGDAIAIRLGQAAVRSVALLGAEGSGVLTAQAAEVTVAEAWIDRPGQAGLAATYRSRLEASSVIVRRSGGTALAAIEEGTILRVDVLDAQHDAQGLLWAECAHGVEVRLGRVRGGEVDKGTRGPCVGRWTAPRLFDPFEGATPPSRAPPARP